MKDQKGLAKPASQSSGTYSASVKATRVSSVRLNVPSINCPINQLLPQIPRQKMRLHGKSLTLPWDSSVKDVGFFMETLEILHRFAWKRQILETLNTSAMHTKSM